VPEPEDQGRAQAVAQPCAEFGAHTGNLDRLIAERRSFIAGGGYICALRRALPIIGCIRVAAAPTGIRTPATVSGCRGSISPFQAALSFSSISSIAGDRSA